ncbi:MAG: ATP-binding protein [Clostridia bacterium]
MKKKIFISLAGTTICLILFFNIFVAYFMYDKTIENEIDTLKLEAMHVAQSINNYSGNVHNYLIYFRSMNRITLLTHDGEIVYDSDFYFEDMENHADRVEINDALLYGEGSDTRFSKTLGEQYFYYATVVNDDYILRVSFSKSSIYAMMLDAMPWFMIVSVLIIGVSIFLANVISKRIVEPIDPKNEDLYDELLPFVNKIKSQQAYIDEQKQDLERRIVEFNAISKNIADGLILVDTKENILSINEKAIEVLGNSSINYINKPFIDLTRIIELQNCVKKAFKGKTVDANTQILSKYYEFRFSPVLVEKNVLGVVVLIVDTTAKTLADQMRREFSANVSHELRTPLTSIYGYAELIKTGIAHENDIVRFAENIWNETSHLMGLIDDIMKLSKLDENSSEFQFVPRNIKDVVENIVSRLDEKARNLDVNIKTSLYDNEILIVENIIAEIFYNIIDNAIKYNKKDGEIEISMNDTQNYVEIIVKDTGIGIPEKSLDRIFERFYRADTSHSSEIVGTGLGLSIVKHGMMVHDGLIDVKSAENKGTTVKISLKK